MNERIKYLIKNIKDVFDIDEIKWLKIQNLYKEKVI